MSSSPVIRKEEGGYKLDLEDNFGFAQYDLNDPMTRPHAQNPCTSSILGHNRFAYITETNRIAIVSPTFFSFAQEIGNVLSLCTALPGFLLALAEVEGEGRLYLLNEDGDVLGREGREEAYYAFPAQVTLLSALANEVVCFRDEEGVYVMDLKFGSMYDLQVPKDARVRYCRFSSENTLLCCWTSVDSESEWYRFLLTTRGDKMDFEKEPLNWEGYLGHSESSILTFSGNDACVHDINHNNEQLIEHLGYIAAGKTDKLSVSATEKYGLILTPSHLHIYERSLTGAWRKQWLKALPPKQRILSSVLLQEHSFFILSASCLICIQLEPVQE